MTGTAETEAAEFQKTYNLDVTVVPTNRVLIRKENQDVVYRTEDESSQRGPGNQDGDRDRAAGAGGHHLSGEIGAAFRHPEADGRAGTRC